ncbi:MFS transporter [Saccharomonospora xinjiangensis]|uniref:MFS transporter n=1 Tax=Saccharomonospora xinjiangensis TaxID=75294 RepID=UPI00350EE4E8
MDVTAREPHVEVSGRRVTVSVAAAGICSFSLLYAPQPLLPQLAAEFGLDPGAASLAVSAGTGGLAAAVLPVAILSELVGKRPVIVASVLASAVLGLLLPFAPSFDILLVLRVLQGVAIAGFPGVAAAYLAELLGPAGVAAAVGAMVAGNTVGGMLGRLAAGGATEWLGWPGALAVVGGIALLCAAVAVATLPRSPRRERAGPHRLRLRTVLSGFLLGLRRPVLLAQYGVALLAMGAFVALYNAATFRLTGEPLDLSPAVASLVFLCYAVGSVSSATAGRLVARFGRLRCLLAALALTAAGAVATVADSLVVVIAGFVVFTGGFFAAHAVASGWAAAEAPPQARASASGLYTLAYYVGSSVGGTLGSVVFGHAGWVWLVGAVVAWLGCAAAGVVALARR